MGVDIRWHIDGQVLFVSFSGVLNDDSIRQMMQQRKALNHLPNGRHIHTLIDFSQVETFDLGIGQLNQVLGNLPQFCSTGSIVGIMETTHRLFLAVQFVTRITMHQIGLDFRMCESVEDGLAYLQTIDQTVHRHWANVS